MYSGFDNREDLLTFSLILAVLTLDECRVHTYFLDKTVMESVAEQKTMIHPVLDSVIIPLSFSCLP